MWKSTSLVVGGQPVTTTIGLVQGVLVARLLGKPDPARIDQTDRSA